MIALREKIAADIRTEDGYNAAQEIFRLLTDYKRSLKSYSTNFHFKRIMMLTSMSFPVLKNQWINEYYKN